MENAKSIAHGAKSKNLITKTRNLKNTKEKIIIFDRINPPSLIQQLWRGRQEQPDISYSK